MAGSPSAMVISVLCVLLLVTAKATSQPTVNSSIAEDSYQCPEREHQFYNGLFECLVPVDEADRCGTLEMIRQCVESREKTCADKSWMTTQTVEGIWGGFHYQTNRLGLTDCLEKTDNYMGPHMSY